jgi:glycyl-tRNA synthetase beta chain
VGEFPEVQGIMGRYYALNEKLPAAVADAIGDHYAPAGPNDRCPSAPVSIAVALADKLEALISFWSIGEKPTGSRDPFALRRAALGIIRIVIENKLRLPLGTFFKAPDLMAFFAERLKVQMREKGVRHDVVDAVLAVGNEDDLVRLLAKVEAVQAFLATEAGKNLLTAYGRAANIVRAEEKKDKGLAAKISGTPDAALLEQAEEKVVASALGAAEQAVGPALAREDFAGAMSAFAGLRGPLDAFFDKVTVNVQDRADLRLNRLKLLNQIRATMDQVADFSKIEG